MAAFPDLRVWVFLLLAPPGPGISLIWLFPAEILYSLPDFCHSPPRTGSQCQEHYLFSASDRPPLAILRQCNDEGALWAPSGVALQFPLFVVVLVGTYKLILPPCVRFVSKQRFHNPTPSFPTHRLPRVGSPAF